MSDNKSSTPPTQTTTTKTEQTVQKPATNPPPAQKQGAASPQGHQDPPLDASGNPPPAPNPPGQLNVVPDPTQHPSALVGASAGVMLDPAGNPPQGMAGQDGSVPPVPRQDNPVNPSAAPAQAQAPGTTTTTEKTTTEQK